ncbi:uncharacterized protein LOC121377864 [Gigantopelta aegis]|uniref:uncharacterized protein LOC121377864 n=1 Tax=Gigantopelta aegis TaxID=1735272 RepID=UPI001B888D4A|nr:uncharacterized protein LOC121377864 [Gigantopelta aegis]
MISVSVSDSKLLGYLSLTVITVSVPESKLLVYLPLIHHRNSWSKTDHRDHLNAKDSPRKLREMLRRQGESVSTHMDYSWNRQPSGYAGNMMTVEDLHEMADQEQYDSYPDVLGRRNSRQRDWAKVKVTLKEMSAKQTEETEAAQKTMYTRY